jgi:hypothetical protein
MTVRSLDLLDLPLLPRFRRDLVVLDSARMLTHGSPLGARTLLSSLDPHRLLHTALCSEEGLALMGQVLLDEDESSARLTFLSPAERINGMVLPLLDHLTAQAGEWGALYLLAEVDEDQPAFRALRQAGFAMYAGQRVWKLPAAGPAFSSADPWQPVDDLDWSGVQSLHAQIVPALLQPVDALPKRGSGLVCRMDGTPQAYMGVKRAAKGIWLQPLVPPDSACPAERLAGLANLSAGGTQLPIYLCVRSYQAWLESALSELGAEPGPQQAVMVKRLTRTVREAQLVRAPEKNLAKAKPAAPMARVESGSSNKIR